jgi:hypothetical protein
MKASMPRARGWGAPRAAALAATACALLGCGGKRAAPRSDLGEATATALLLGVAKAELLLEPWPCAALDEAAVPPAALKLEGWRLEGLALVPEEEAAVRTVGFVADAADGAPETVARLRSAATAMAEGGAGLVISLGGMGEDEESIASSLRALTAGGAAKALVVLAMPGDLEPLAAHRKAVLRLQREALPVLDGSVVRWVKLGSATIATLPGARHQEQLVAGNQGCAFDDASVEATLGRLAEGVGIRVLAAWAAPRGDEPTEAAGDLRLREALDRAHVDLVVSGEPAGGGALVERAGRPGGPVDLAHTGFSDAEPRMPVGGQRSRATALLVKLARNEWQLQRVELTRASKATPPAPATGGAGEPPRSGAPSR